MKVTIQNDDGTAMSLDTSLTVLPPGCTVLICPAGGDTYIPETQKRELEARLLEMNIRAVVVPIAVCVWTIAADDARP